MPSSEDQLRQQALTVAWQAACSNAVCCVREETAVCHVITALHGHDIAKLRMQDLSTIYGQPLYI